MDAKFLEGILKALDKTSASYFCLEDSDAKIEILRSSSLSSSLADQAPSLESGSISSDLSSVALSALSDSDSSGLAASVSSDDISLASDKPSDKKEAQESEKEAYHDVLSEHVGFVQRSSPGKDAAPIVKLREVVEKGQLLAYIRSMNIRYNVVSDIRGKIVEVLVEDRQAVEYGQPIFRLKPLS